MAKMALQLPLAAITRTARVLSIRQHRLISTLNHGFSTLSISRNFNSTLRLRPTYRTSFSYPPLSTSTKTCSANTIIRVPTMAESITEGTLVQMKKNVGDFVEENEELATIETDKIDVSVNAPHPGIMQRLLAREGDTVAVEQIIAELQFAGDKRPGSTPEIEQARDEKVPHPEEKISERSENTQEKLESSREPENVILPSRGSEPLQTSHEAVSQESKARSKEHRVKMTRIRQKTAQHLKPSQNTAAFLTTFNEVDMSRLMKFRKENREQVLQQHGIKLGYMGAMARASALALKKIPAVNAAIENGDTIVYRDYVDLSVAAAIPKGLVTPVLQNIELMSLIEIEKNISDLVAKARDGKLTMEDLIGGSFTISNSGIWGSLFGTPIINMPQTAVLGVYGIQDRPVAVNGEVQIRPIMYIALTYDHRIIDGREAVKYLNLVKGYLEEPSTMLLH